MEEILEEKINRLLPTHPSFVSFVLDRAREMEEQAKQSLGCIGTWDSED